MRGVDLERYRRLITGESRGPMAAGVRGALRAASLPYEAAVRWRNLRFDRDHRRVHRVPVPVVSVGNLTTGGTGKTPLVAWLAEWFRNRGVRAAVVSRGYGSLQDGGNDEGRELEQRLPEVPHVQDPDRVAASMVAIEKHDAQLILLDDAFQHRRIHRDLDLLVVDALDPFGSGYLLPRGLLREPLDGIRRADAVILSRADLVTAEVRESVKKQIDAIAERPFVAVAHEPRELLSVDGDVAPLDALRGPIVAFCGIGNPDGFRRTLAACGADVLDYRTFPDHHAYPKPDIDKLDAWVAGIPDARLVVCTHKDLVKLGADRLGGRPLRALVVGIAFLQDKETLEAMLQPLAERAAAGQQ